MADQELTQEDIERINGLAKTVGQAPPLFPGSPPPHGAQLPGFEVRPGIRQVPPGTPVTTLPSPGEYIWENFKKNLPSIAGMTAATALPGAQVPLLGKAIPGTGAISGPLARIGLGSGAAAGVGGLQGGAEGAKKEGVEFGIGQAGGEMLGGAARVTGNTLIRNQFAKEQAGKVAELLKKHIPALASFGNDAKALHDMVYGRGSQAVSAEFDKALKAGIAEARSKNIRVPILAEDAEKLGIVGGGLDALDPFRGTEAKNLRALLPSAPADQVAEKVLGWWKKDPALYRRVVNALDEAGVGDPKAREAYKYYIGFSNFMDKTKALSGEQFHPERAMSGKWATGTGGLGDLKQVGELRRRGMTDMMDLLRGPGEEPMTISRINPWYRHLIGAGVGGTMASPLGLHAVPYGAGLGGIAGTAMVPKQIYHNTPLTEGSKAVLQQGPIALGQLGRDFFKGQQVTTSSEKR